MRRVLFAAFVAALMVLAPRLLAPKLWATLPQESQDSEDERIRAFESHITVNQNGSMDVTETITVKSAGVNIRRGIYRDFPTRYKDHLGNNYSVTLDILGLERDGSTEAYHTQGLSNGERIFFGGSSYDLPPGVHTYKFSYRTSRQLGFFKDHDQLYWNVTGLGWMFPIDLATATVVLPTEVRHFVKGLDGFTGYEGDKGKAFTVGRDPQGNPVFRSENLLPHQGLSLLVTWPKGLMRPPSAAEKRQQFIGDNKGIVAGAIGLALVWLYYVMVWLMVGRDPRTGTIVPLYEPQDNLSAAGMRFLERMGFDDKVFTAAILGLTAKGYLTIERDSQTYRLLRKSGYGTVEPQLSADEQLLAQKLFAEGDKLSLTEHNSLLRGAQDALKSNLQSTMEKKYFFTNARYQWPGVILTALAVVVMVLLAGGSGPGIFMSIWLTGWSVGVTVLMVSVIHAWKGVASGAGSVTLAIFATLFSVPFVGGELFGLFLLRSTVGYVPIFIILVGVLTSLLFHYLLKAPTLAGRALMDRVERFRMFLKAVDGDRINRTSPLAKTPELFERYLPYALALGVEHAWAQQFSQVLAAAAEASSQGSRGYSPSWYSGAGVAAFSPADFTSSFSDSFSGAVSSASTPSSSSGSGGGGFSGGGGGGGGGGGW
ncbi:MAG TPA: DUF2207 domain-containing protein [Terriglobales bacterium]